VGFIFFFLCVLCDLCGKQRARLKNFYHRDRRVHREIKSSQFSSIF
jgi:hypothetical protein